MPQYAEGWDGHLNEVYYPVPAAIGAQNYQTIFEFPGTPGAA